MKAGRRAPLLMTAGLCVLAGEVLLAAPKPPLPIYVFTSIDPSGLVDADQKRRQDSVRDLRGVLDKGLKKFEPVLVDRAENAVILVEVLASGMEDLGDRTHVQGAFGVSSERVSKKRIVRARVTLGTYTTEIASPPKVYSWKMAAAHWQREFRKWANANADRLRQLTARSNSSR